MTSEVNMTANEPSSSPSPEQDIGQPVHLGSDLEEFLRTRSRIQIVLSAFKIRPNPWGTSEKLYSNLLYTEVGNSDPGRPHPAPDNISSLRTRLLIPVEGHFWPLPGYQRFEDITSSAQGRRALEHLMPKLAEQLSSCSLGLSNPHFTLKTSVSGSSEMRFEVDWCEGVKPEEIDTSAWDEQGLPFSLLEDTVMLCNIFVQMAPSEQLDSSQIACDAVAARSEQAMSILHDYVRTEEQTEFNAQTISILFHEGSLSFYAHHVRRRGDRREYFTNRILQIPVCGTKDSYRLAMMAVHNAREWAQEQRSTIIAAVHERLERRKLRREKQSRGCATLEWMAAQAARASKASGNAKGTSTSHARDGDTVNLPIRLSPRFSTLRRPNRDHNRPNPPAQSLQRNETWPPGILRSDEAAVSQPPTFTSSGAIDVSRAAQPNETAVRTEAPRIAFPGLRDILHTAHLTMAPDSPSPTPRAENSAPRAEDSAPRAGDSAPRAGDSVSRVEPPAPRVQDSAPRAGDSAPRAEYPAPRAGDSAPRVEPSAPRAEDSAPRAEYPAPRRGDSASRVEPPAPRAQDSVPMAEDPAPRAEDSAPRAEDPAPSRPYSMPPPPRPREALRPSRREPQREKRGRGYALLRAKPAEQANKRSKFSHDK